MQHVHSMLKCSNQLVHAATITYILHHMFAYPWLQLLSSSNRCSIFAPHSQQPTANPVSCMRQSTAAATAAAATQASSTQTQPAVPYTHHLETTHVLQVERTLLGKLFPYCCSHTRHGPVYPAIPNSSCPWHSPSTRVCCSCCCHAQAAWGCCCVM
jgi:hypothetical protein